MTFIKLIGVGGHSKVIMNIANLCDILVTELYDDNTLAHNTKFCGVMVLDSIKDSLVGNLIIAIGDNITRKLISEKCSKANWQTIIHPSVIISKDVEIGEGTVIMAGAIIQPGTRIGKHCIINTGACVDHDCILQDFVHISPNAALAGNVIVSEGSHIGIGATIIQGVYIGKWAIIGAGAVILKDVPDYAVIVGNPGKIIKYNSIENE